VKTPARHTCSPNSKRWTRAALFPASTSPTSRRPGNSRCTFRQADKAFSNTPQLSETAEPNGMKRVVFAETKPLPSYLVAFAIGPFDVVNAGKAGRNHVPVRIITPRGKAAQAKYAAQVTATIIGRLEELLWRSLPL
jgi:cytosol alanyl aminopeptidase